MGIAGKQARSPGGGLAFSNRDESWWWTILKFVGLIVLDAFGLLLTYTELLEGDVGLGIMFGLITLGVNVIIFVPSLFPLKWMTPGLVLISLLVIYPVIYTVSVAFTNYGDGHRFDKQDTVDLIGERGYVPENARTFDYTPYVAGEEDYALWLEDTATGDFFFATQGEALQPVDSEVFGFQLPGSPDSRGFEELEQPGPLIGAIGGQLTEFEFAEPVNQVAVSMTSPQAADTDARYVVQATTQTLYDREQDTTYDVTVLYRESDDAFGFYWEREDGTAVLARPSEPIYFNNEPFIDGYSIIDATTLADQDIQALNYTDPLEMVQVTTLDEITQDDFGTYTISPQYVFDPEEGLTRDRDNGTVFDTTVFQNPAGEYAFWLTQTGISNPKDAVMILPDENKRDVDIGNRRALDTLNIELTPGTSIPDSIGVFERTTVEPDAIMGLEMAGVTSGFEVDTVNFDVRYQFDPAQGLTLDTDAGTIYRTSVYDSDEGDGYALFMDRGRNLPGQINTLLARPDETLFINGSPASYQGYNLATTDRERTQAFTFLQNIEVDYFGEPDATSNERIGIIDTQQAGQPFLMRYIWNEEEQAFVDLTSIDATQFDLDTLELDVRSPYSIEGLLEAVLYDSNDTEGIFEAMQLRFVYNEPADTYVDLYSVDLSEASEFSGTDIATEELGSLPPVAGADRFNEFTEQNVFAPEGFAYNATVDGFVTPGSSDETPDSLATMSLDEIQAVEGARVYLWDEAGELYVPPDWVYNEPAGAYINLSDIDRASLDLEGLDLQSINLDTLERLPEVTYYQEFSEQGVFTPQGFVYNEPGNAFVDVDSISSRFETEDLDATTADIETNEALQTADIYVLNEATGLYVPPSYVYNTQVEAFIDTERLPEEINLEGVDLQTVDPFTVDGMEDVQFISQEAAREPLLYAENVAPTFNEKVEAYLYLPETQLPGVDLATVDPETVTTILDAPTVRARANSIRISPLVYSDTLNRTNLDGERFVLGDARGAEELNPGYRVNIGADNFLQLVQDSRLLTPFINIFVWTVTFALLSVLLTFAVGLFMALVMNDRAIPGKKIIRSLLIIPYAIPGVIGILVWQGMLNQNLGIITNGIADAFGVRIPWFTDPTWAKIAILMVNLWLGYPYMMLVSSGALQAIPSDVYEAAAVDGARPRQQFWNITLPLLLVTVGPLMIASFTFNFNNYLMIELLTAGDPPIPGTPTPAGYTDILISYTYNLAFGTDRGADYGYASAITIVIFAIVAVITMFQFRFTRQWEEVGENV